MSCKCHFQIHASRPERLMTFYSTLFGWTFEKQAGVEDCWFIQVPGAQDIDGSLKRRLGDSPLGMQAFNAFVCLFEVDSLEQSMALLVELGGQVVEAQVSMPTLGTLVYAKDPNGNVFGMIARATPP